VRPRVYASFSIAASIFANWQGSQISRVLAQRLGSGFLGDFADYSLKTTEDTEKKQKMIRAMWNRHRSYLLSIVVFVRVLL